MNYKNIGTSVIELVGGKENITSVMHCATRLRLQLKDVNIVNKNQLEDVEGVKGVFEVNGQYQIIFGSGTVNMVCAEVKSILGIQDEIIEEKVEGNFIQRIVKTLSDIFVPIIPAIVAGGLLMGINNILTASGIFHDTMSLIELNPGVADLASIINMFANASFVFLPVLLGFSATKKFGGNPYLGAVMGMIMVHPDLLNAYSYAGATEIPTWNLFGLSIEAVGYQGTVLPVLGVSWIIAKLETKLRKVTPSWLDNLTTPLLAVMITGFITFIFVGPILRDAGDFLAIGITWLYDSLGFIGAGIFGLLYAPIVITGLHHSFSAVETTLLATTGESFIFTTAAMSNVAQGAAVLAVLALTKDGKIKSLCSASGISALLGITEPAMFGVNLRLKYPFIGAMTGSALGSAYLSLTGVKATALGAAGLPAYLSVAPNNYFNLTIGLVISMATAFIVTAILFKRDALKNNVVVNNKIHAPMDGTYKEISKSSDAVFASKAMGEGVCVVPTNGSVYAPFDGKVVMIFDTKHAIGLVNDQGVEVLIHCGINTVNLEGKPFNVHVKNGQVIKQGDLLLEMDLKQVEELGCSIETLVVITSKNSISMIKEDLLKAKEEVITLD